MMVDIVARLHLDGLGAVVRRGEDASADVRNLEEDFFLLNVSFI